MTTKSVLRVSSPLALYAGVFIGLFLLRSGWAAILGYHLALIAVLTIGKGWHHSKLVLKGWSTQLVAILSAASFLGGALLYLLWPILHHDGLTMRSFLSGLSLDSWAWMLFVPYFSFVNPVLEEVFWRGWFSSRLEHPIVSDLFFAGYHLLVLILVVKTVWVFACFLVLLLLARTLRLVAVRGRGLATAVVSHAVGDLAVMTAVSLLR